MKLNRSIASPTPSSTPATIALGYERMLASTNAITALDSVIGPRLSSPPTPPLSVEKRIIAIVETSPAAVHTKVEISFGLMLDNRASDGLSAAASTERPNVVR